LKNIFIFDACALIALLAAEDGSEKVRDLILDAIDGNILLKMNQVNLLEVYYYLCNVYNFEKILKKEIIKINWFR